MANIGSSILAEYTFFKHKDQRRTILNHIITVVHVSPKIDLLPNCCPEPGVLGSFGAWKGFETNKDRGTTNNTYLPTYRMRWNSMWIIPIVIWILQLPNMQNKNRSVRCVEQLVGSNSHGREWRAAEAFWLATMIGSGKLSRGLHHWIGLAKSPRYVKGSHCLSTVSSQVNPLLIIKKELWSLFWSGSCCMALADPEGNRAQEFVDQWIC